MVNNTKGCETAIVLAVYNRPDCTAKSVAQVAAAHPSHLFVVADGPKEDVTEDGQKCAAVLDEVKRISWPGEVHWNIAPTNLGCRKRIQTGLAWVFEHVDSAIIVEDDCVLDPSFFVFTSELLDYYRHDPRIGVISAQSIGTSSAGVSYHLSKFPLIWGWATWRRTWQIYEPDMDSWPSVRETDWLECYLGDPFLAAYWRAVFDQTKAGADTWDYQLTYSFWRHRMLAIHPSVNLVRNVGFGADATHCFTGAPSFALQKMPFPLAHPESLDPDTERDALVAANCGITQKEAFRRARASMTKLRNVRRDRSGHTIL
jgi:hypothetical protein